MSLFLLSRFSPKGPCEREIEANMADTKGDTPKKQQQQPQQPPPQLPPQPSSPVVDPLDESPDARQPPPAAHHLHQPQPSAAALVVTGSPFISAPLFIPAIGTGAAGTTPSPFEQFEVVNPKRPRFGQWKLLASPTSHQLPTKQPSQMAGLPAESSPSPTHNIPQAHVTTASSSDTASSPITHSPIPGTGAGHEASKPEGGGSGELPSFHQQHHPQFRKGKYVSPVWKPNEMLWLVSYLLPLLSLSLSRTETLGKDNYMESSHKFGILSKDYLELRGVFMKFSEVFRFIPCQVS